ncbi:MAG TPA: hypothetical protein VFK02_08955 [Kofleriaceae bacterium]|nr:hypothetical protein [Kofleriaceae bacterium]
MTVRDQWLPRLRRAFDGRPVAWAGGRVIGDYDGRERTLDVFDADARDQLDLLTRFRALRSEIEAALGGPIIVLFHTTKETTRLFPNVGGLHHLEERVEALVHRLGEILPEAHVEHRRDNPYEPHIVIAMKDRKVLIRCDATAGYAIYLVDVASLEGEPDFRTTSVERAAQSVRLLMPEDDAFVAELKAIPERRPVDTGTIIEDPADLNVRDQVVEANGRQPPRRAA